MEHGRIEAAIDALSRPGRLGEAEARVAELAPQLGAILTTAIEQGGWLDAQDRSLRQAASADDPDDRVRLARELLADQARMGMLVGVAVGWELARELDPSVEDPSATEEGD